MKIIPFVHAANLHSNLCKHLSTQAPSLWMTSWCKYLIKLPVQVLWPKICVLVHNVTPARMAKHGDKTALIDSSQSSHAPQCERSSRRWVDYMRLVLARCLLEIRDFVCRHVQQYWCIATAFAIRQTSQQGEVWWSPYLPPTWTVRAMLPWCMENIWLKWQRADGQLPQLCDLSGSSQEAG